MNPGSELDFASVYRNRRVLITGAAGYVAAAILARLAFVSCEVFRLSRRLPLAPPAGATAAVIDLSGDVQSPSIWTCVPDDIDVIFHLAAQTNVYAANDNPQADLSANVLPVLQLLEHCQRRSRPPYIVLAGTATTVGLPKNLPVSETQPDRPVTIYDLHKFMAEQYVEYFSRLGPAQGCTLRLANVYGPGPPSSNANRGVLNMMIRRALRGEAVTLYGTGEQLRDYVFVDDVAGAFLAAGARPDLTAGRHFLIGSGAGHTLRAAFTLVTERVMAITGRRVPVVTVDSPTALSPIETRNFVADIRAMTCATGWLPKISLQDGIDRTISAFCQENQ